MIEHDYVKRMLRNVVLNITLKQENNFNLPSLLAILDFLVYVSFIDYQLDNTAGIWQPFCFVYIVRSRYNGISRNVNTYRDVSIYIDILLEI